MAPQASSQWPDGSAQATTISNSVAKAADSELTGATTATALTSLAKQAAFTQTLQVIANVCNLGFVAATNPAPANRVMGAVNNADTTEFRTITEPDRIDISAGTLVRYGTTFRNFENDIGHQDADACHSSGAGSGHDRKFSTVFVSFAPPQRRSETACPAGQQGPWRIGHDRDTLITGNSGKNAMDGGTGKDRLLGSGSNHGPSGGAGADGFVVSTEAVPDRLTDFDLAQPGKVIDPSTAPILDFAERVASHLSPLGADAVIARGANLVTLVGIPGADLAAGEMPF